MEQQFIPPPPPPPPFPFEQPPVQIQQSSPQQQQTQVQTESRIWLHPWTSDEIRQNASIWSLASDAGLLLHLEQFSTKLTERAETIRHHLNQTAQAVKATHTRVQNSLNEFTALANTQFIENRVYDDDESTISKKDEQQTSQSSSSPTGDPQHDNVRILQKFVESIQSGLSILDTHFERVDTTQVLPQVNGVQDDFYDDGMVIDAMLEPKDPYVLRLLPYLIGTAEFIEDDYVGLKEIDEKEIEDEHYAFEPSPIKNDSDSVIGSSETESINGEYDAPVKQVIVPTGHSKLNERDLFAKEEEEEAGFFTSNKTATTDLFPKTTSQQQPQLNDAENDDLFGISSQPPSTVAPKFKNLFNQQSADEEINETDDVFGIITTKPTSSLFPTQPPTSNLFESNTDDKDLFGETTVENGNIATLPSKERTVTGGVSMLSPSTQIKDSDGKTELQKAVERRRKQINLDKDITENNDDDVPERVQPRVQSLKPPLTSNKQDAISALVPQPLSTAPQPQPPTTSVLNMLNPKPSSLFVDTPTDNEDDDDGLFTATTVKKLPTTKSVEPSYDIFNTKKKTLFDDVEEDTDSSFSFGIKQKPTTVIPTIAPTQVEAKTFLDVEDDSDDDLFGVKPIAKKTTATAPAVTTIPIKSVLTSPQLDDEDNDRDDLFGIKKTSTTKTSVLTVNPPVQPQSTDISTGIIPNRQMAQDSSDEDDLFGPSRSSTKQPIPTISSTTIPKKQENIVDNKKLSTPSVIQTKSQPPVATTQQKILATSPSSDDDLFPSIIKSTTESTFSGVKVLPPLQTTMITEKKTVQSPLAMSPSSDEDLFGPLKKVDTNDDKLAISSTITKSQQTPLSTAPLSIPPTTVVSSPTAVISSPDDDENLFGITGLKPVVQKIVDATPITPIKSVSEIQSSKPLDLPDEDDSDLFGIKSKPSPIEIKNNKNLTEIKSPLVIKPDEKTDLIKKHPVIETRPAAKNEAKKQVNILEDDSDEELFGDKNKTKSIKSKISSIEKENNDETKNKKPDVINQDEKVKTNVKQLSSLLKINPSALMPGAIRPKSSSVLIEKEEDDKLLTTSEVASKEDESTTKSISSNVVKDRTPSIVNTELTQDQTMLNILKDKAKLASTARRTPPSRKTRTTPSATAIANDDLFQLSSTIDESSEILPEKLPSPEIVTKSPVIPVIEPKLVPPTTVVDIKKTKIQIDDDDDDLFGIGGSKNGSITAAAATTTTANAQIDSSKSLLVSVPSIFDDNKIKLKKEQKKFSIFDSDNEEDDDDLFGKIKIHQRPKSSGPTQSQTDKSIKPAEKVVPSTATKSKGSAVFDNDVDDLLKPVTKKQSSGKQSVQSLEDDIFGDIKIPKKETNKAKKDWSIMNTKQTTNNIDTDDLFGSTTTSTSKSKQSSSSKMVNISDDIFDDPLNLMKKT